MDPVLEGLSMKLYFNLGLSFGIALFWIGPVLALDLTPRLVEDTSNDGGDSILRLVFQEGKKKVSFILPKNWTAEGGLSELIFQPGKNSETLVKFTVKKGDSVEFDDKAVADCHDRVQGLLKEGAKNFLILDETKNPVLSKGWPSYQIIGRYNFYGRWVKIGMIFINLDPKQQMTVLITGPESEFDPIFAAAKNLLITSIGWPKPS